ncbi:MAG TPA: TMEM175 family protein [Alphaproteobacteria bacterium]|nr:TMEM175 family protein [Alphaproteobacteria bacterium]
MDKDRILAFSDGVIAIIITITVLELKTPSGADLRALSKDWPVLVSYVLSFTYVGIYWNNHHHLFAACNLINASIMWANLHLLFWLSLIPFVTDWMGGNNFAPLPTALYGSVLLMGALAYKILQGRILAIEPPGSPLRSELGPDLKGALSPLVYLLGIGLAFYLPWIAFGLYVLVALAWLVPDRRIERALSRSDPR